MAQGSVTRFTAQIVNFGPAQISGYADGVPIAQTWDGVPVVARQGLDGLGGFAVAVANLASFTITLLGIADVNNVLSALANAPTPIPQAFSYVDLAGTSKFSGIAMIEQLAGISIGGTIQDAVWNFKVVNAKSTVGSPPPPSL